MRRKEWGEELLGTDRNSFPIPLQSSEAGREGGDTGKGELKLSLRRRAGGLWGCGDVFSLYFSSSYSIFNWQQIKLILPKSRFFLWQ